MSLTVFGRQPAVVAGTFASDSAIVSFSGLAGNNVGLLTQSLEFNFTQRITRLYSIGSPYVFMVIGRAHGEGSAGMIVGPANLSTAFLRRFGSGCPPGTLLLHASVGCGNNTGSIDFVLTGVILESVRIAISNPEEMIISEGVKFVYASLQV
jgi:hypothetical protein